MTDVTVEVRAEQRFEDWAYGEVRTVPRTPRVETLIAAGRLTVIETHEPAPAAAPPKFGFGPSDSAPTDSQPEPEVEPDRPPRQTRRQNKE